MANLSSYDTKSSLEHWRVLLGENIRIEVGDLPKGSAQSRSTSKGANTGGACGRIYVGSDLLCVWSSRLFNGR